MGHKTVFFVVTSLLLSVMGGYASQGSMPDESAADHRGSKPVVSVRILPEPEGRLERVKDRLGAVEAPVPHTVNELGFWQVVAAFKERKLIDIGGKEYAVLKEMPELRDSFSEVKRANPCYKYGLGPNLLKFGQIDQLPSNAEWLMAPSDQTPCAAAHCQGSTYLTLRYVANNNLHWENFFTHPDEFRNIEDRYWHEEVDRYQTRPLRTVNFLLKLTSI